MILLQPNKRASRSESIAERATSSELTRELPPPVPAHVYAPPDLTGYNGPSPGGGGGGPLRADVPTLGSEEATHPSIWFNLMLFILQPFDSAYRDALRSQSALETGHWRSRRYLEDNNAFGMRCATTRPQRRKGCTSDGFAIYGSVFSSIIDRMRWDKYNKIPRPGDMTREAGIGSVDQRKRAYMMSVLSKGYVPASDRDGYLNLWERIDRDLNGENAPWYARLARGVLWWLLLGFIVLAFWYWYGRRKKRTGRRWFRRRRTTIK